MDLFPYLDFYQEDSIINFSLIIDTFIDRLKHIGEIPICNGLALHAPHIGDFCFILCYRCSSILLGLITTGIALLDNGLYNSFYKINQKWRYLITFVLVIVTFIDGTLQIILMEDGSNFRRVITGFISGVGLSLLAEQIMSKILHKEIIDK